MLNQEIEKAREERDADKRKKQILERVGQEREMIRARIIAKKSMREIQQPYEEGFLKNMPMMKEDLVSNVDL